MKKITVLKMSYVKFIMIFSIILFQLIHLVECTNFFNIDDHEKFFDVNVELHLREDKIEENNLEIREFNFADFKENIRRSCFKKKDKINEYFKSEDSSYNKCENLCMEIINDCLSKFHLFEIDEDDSRICSYGIEISKNNTFFKKWVLTLHDFHSLNIINNFSYFWDKLYDFSEIKEDGTVEVFFSIVKIFYSAMPKELILFVWSKLEPRLLKKTIKSMKCRYDESKYNHIFTVFKLASLHVLNEEIFKLDEILNAKDNKKKFFKFVIRLDFDFVKFHSFVCNSKKIKQSITVDDILNGIRMKLPKIQKFIVKNTFSLFNYINIPGESTIELKIELIQILDDINRILEKYDNDKLDEFSFIYISSIELFKLSIFYYKRFIRVERNLLDFLEFKFVCRNLFSSTLMFKIIPKNNISETKTKILTEKDSFEKCELKSSAVFCKDIITPIREIFDKILNKANPIFLKRWAIIMSKIQIEYNQDFYDIDLFSYSWYSICFSLFLNE